MTSSATPSLVRPALWMLAGAFSFTIMGALTHLVGARCDWLTIALSRAFFMLLISAGAAKLGGASLVVWRPKTLWLRSLAGSFSLVCSFYALTRLPVGEVLTLTNTYPLWILVLSTLVGRRLPTTVEVVGIALGMTGVFLIEQPKVNGDDFAAGVALVSAVSTALAMIGLHRLRNVDPRAVVAHFSGVATLVAGTWMAARLTVGGERFGKFDPEIALLVLGVGVFGTIGQVFLTKAYAAGAPAKVSVLGLTQVVFGLAFDVLFWRRSLPWLSILGTLFILGPAAWLIARSTAGASLPRKSKAPLPNS